MNPNKKPFAKPNHKKSLEAKIISHQGIVIRLLVQSLLYTFSNHLKLKSMGQELDDLKAAVQRDTEVDQSAITLLNGLKQKLDDAIASGDPAELKKLSDTIGASSQSLADAVVANTPAESAGS